MSRFNNLSSDSDTVCQKHENEQDTAINDAEIEIQELLRKTARLKQAVRIFRATRKMESGGLVKR
jgi:hypothetical protein